MSSRDVQILNDLIETTLDSADGYAEAAAKIHSTRYGLMFQERANERHQVAARLQQQVHALGGLPEEQGSTLGAAHRMFADLRRTLGSETALLTEVERGESYLRRRYEAALEEGAISPHTRELIADTFQSIARGQQQMLQLRRAASGP